MQAVPTALELKGLTADEKVEKLKLRSECVSKTVLLRTPI